jgi:uncharacterized protein YndB with AHSA1/START domain
MNSHILGSLELMDDGAGLVRMERIYDTDIANLWSAPTDPVRLARWVAEVQGDLRAGGHIRARFTSEWDGQGRIDVCDAPRRLVVAWEPCTSDATRLEAILLPVVDGAHLVIEERGIPYSQLPSYGAGWQTHLEDLASYLAGHQTSVWQNRCLELKPRYQRLADSLPHMR